MKVMRVHPCFDGKAHHTYGRMHLPVAEKCNVKCRYCAREVGVSYHSYRPAACERILTPEEAVERVSLHLDDTLKVVGIAGPGEPLCNAETFRTLELLHETYDVLLCISTNGLLLWEKAPTLSELGVRTVTVTVNTVDARTVPKIYAHINGKMDEKTAQTFVDAQLRGIEACVELGILVKVNSVLIPEINMNGILPVAVEAQKRGASLQNITPLIPLSEFSGLRPPSCEELQEVRGECENVLSQFRWCKQCRADAVGIPGVHGDGER